MFLRTRSWTVLQCTVCLCGLAASAVPVLPRTGAFWGILRSWTSTTPDCVIVSEVEPGSPAAEIGLQPLDRIDRVNGHTFSTAEHFDGLIRQITSAAPVELMIRRPTRELRQMIAKGNVTINVDETQTLEALEYRLTLQGTSAAPELEAVMYYDWQFAAAAMFAGIAIFVIATVPLRRARWRSATVIIVVLLSLVLIPTLIRPWGTTIVWRRWLVDTRPRAWGQLIACVSAGLAVLTLAIFELRGVSRRSPQLPDSCQRLEEQ